MPLIGSHATVTGGLAAGGLAYAAAAGAEVIQVFVSNPRGWAAGPGSAAEDRRLRDSGMPVFIHVTYMVNLGSGNPEVAAKSADAVAHALRRGGEIGARGVVAHTGSAVGWDRERALRQLGELTLPLLTSSATTIPTCCSSRWPGKGRCCARGRLTLGLTSPRWIIIRKSGSAWTRAICSRLDMTSPCREACRRCSPKWSKRQGPAR